MVKNGGGDGGGGDDQPFDGGGGGGSESTGDGPMYMRGDPGALRRGAVYFEGIGDIFSLYGGYINELFRTPPLKGDEGDHAPTDVGG